MKNLHIFISKVESYINKNGLQDVLELIPFFNQFDFPSWKSWIDVKQGKPITTTIFQSETIRIIIICWNPKQQSTIHGHKEGGGLIKVLQGRLHETRFDPVDKRKLGEFSYGKSDIRYIHDMFAWHQVENPNENLACSLHLYTRLVQAA